MNKWEPLALTVDEMDQQYSLEIGNYDANYYIDQLGEIVAILFPEDLVREYEATRV